MTNRKSKGGRRKARELALSALYMIDQQSINTKLTADDENEIIERFLKESAAQPETLDYASRLIDGVRRKIKDIDRQIEEASEHWRIERIAQVDRNILRIAAYEILFDPEVPPQVSIDEAVEIAAKYGSRQSSAFVNGVLDTIWKNRL